MKLSSNTQTTTASSGSTVQITADMRYFVDAIAGKAILRVLRKAAKWKHDCCGKRTGKKFCESHGCASLDELLQPLRDLGITGRKKRRP